MIGHFMKNPNQVFEREQLIELLWEFDSEIEGRMGDSMCETCVTKFAVRAFKLILLSNRPGLGYRWVMK